MKISDHFHRSEFKCRCGRCDFDTVDVKLIDILEMIRSYFDKPVKINSACRCKKHNKSIGSKDTSQHVKGKAADIVVKDVSPEKVADYAEKIMHEWGGVGRYSDFTHLDVRQDKARWGSN